MSAFTTDMFAYADEREARKARAALRRVEKRLKAHQAEEKVVALKAAALFGTSDDQVKHVATASVEVGPARPWVARFTDPRWFDEEAGLIEDEDAQIAAFRAQLVAGHAYGPEQTWLVHFMSGSRHLIRQFKGHLSALRQAWPDEAEQKRMSDARAHATPPVAPLLIVRL